MESVIRCPREQTNSLCLYTSNYLGANKAEFSNENIPTCSDLVHRIESMLFVNV